MDSSDIENEQQIMRLRSAFVYWVICLAILIIIVVIAASFESKKNDIISAIFGYSAFFFYIGAGIYLNRAVLRKIIDWHPMYSTLQNVTSAKLKFFFLWPITYFILFVRLGINKVL